MKICPYCAKEIQDDAMVCQFCNHEIVAAAAQPPVSAVSAPLPEAKTSGKAVASLILSFFSWCFIPGVIAVVLGHIAYSEIKKSAGQLKGKGVAIAGLILGYGGIAMIPFILIVAAIAIPNLLRARAAANEASAVGSLRTLNVAQVTYASTYNTGFSPDITSLGSPPAGAPTDGHASGLIDDVLAKGQKSGYVFTYTVTEKDENGTLTGYTITAEPVQPGNTGQRYFFTDQTGVIRVERDRQASQESPPLY
jgi:type IV pilus assembly protein PilA